jgi:hypothetical protein
MPTNRKRVSRGIVQQEIEGWKIEMMQTGTFDREGVDPWAALDGYTMDEWKQCRTQILSSWPLCSRPFAWFKWDAPRFADKFTTYYFHLSLPEPRLKVGGGGKQWHRDYLPECSWAVFDHWKFKKSNPPLIESEAAYLQRLDLLSAKEVKHLEKNPALLEPIKITDLGRSDGQGGFFEFDGGF